MGKAAANERLKLVATYNNNIAVGLAVVGFLLPTIGLVPWLPRTLAEWSLAEWTGDWRVAVRAALYILPNAAAGVLAFYASVVLHRHALKVAENIQD